MSDITLRTTDGTVMIVASQVVRRFAPLRRHFKDSSGPAENDVVLVENLSGRILGDIVKWVERHPNGRYKGDSRESIRWESEFFNIDEIELAQLILGAEYLRILDLQFKATQYMQDKMHDSTAEDLCAFQKIREEIKSICKPSKAAPHTNKKK